MSENRIITSQWTRISQSPGETADAAAALAPLFAPAGLVVLSGDLGSGKTTLTQQLLRVWGYTGAVKSPTFDLVHVYNAQGLTVYHVDLYRMHRGQSLEVLDLPAPEDPSSVIIAEWGDALRAVYPEYFHLSLSVCGEQCRALSLGAQGQGCQSRLDRWRDHTI